VTAWATLTARELQHTVAGRIVGVKQIITDTKSVDPVMARSVD